MAILASRRPLSNAFFFMRMQRQHTIIKRMKVEVATIKVVSHIDMPHDPMSSLLPGRTHRNPGEKDKFRVSEKCDHCLLILYLPVVQSESSPHWGAQIAPEIAFTGLEHALPVHGALLIVLTL